MSSTNNKNPTILIINGANWLGARLVEILTENEGNVIVVDDFCEANMPFIKKFSENKRFVFIERDKINSVRENFTRIKYFIHLKNDFNSKDDDVSSKHFISETKFVDAVLTLALEKNSTYLLVSSIHLHKDFVLRKNFTRTRSAYTESDLQDYIERTVLEYHQKAGLNSRIARLGNIYGPEMDLSKDSLLMQIFTDAFYNDSIKVYGDGLEFMYYIYITDAIQGILRAIFTPGTEGQVYSLTNPDEISVLSIVNKVLGLQPRAKKIKFLPGNSNTNPLYEKAYIPDPNLSEIGWAPSISFDRGLASVYDYFRKDVSNNPQSEVSYKTVSDNDIKIDFDNTLNLSNSFYGYNYNESEQFKEFYKKLNNPDSPIFNAAIKSTNYDPRKYLEKVGEKQRTKKYIIRTVIVLILVFCLGVFILFPGVRLGLLDVNIKNKTELLIKNTGDSSADYRNRVGNTNFQLELRDSLSTVSGIISLLGKQSDVENYIIGMQGLDRAFSIYDQIRSENLIEIIYATEQLTEDEYLRLSRLLVDINLAQKEIQMFPDSGITSSIHVSLNSVDEWLGELKDEVSTRITLTS